MTPCAITTELSEDPCLAMEATAGLRQRWPDLGVSRGFVLPRARLGGALARGPVGMDVEVAAVRTGGDAGYLGVLGESIVPRVELWRAVGVWAFKDNLTLVATAGLVPDRFVAAVDGGALVGGALPYALDRGLLDRSDLGGGLLLHSDTIDVALDATSGEGLARRERNDGVDLTAFVDVHPGEHVHVHVQGRDGSRGMDRARDHRLAARVLVDFEHVDAGLESVSAWGIDADPLRTALGGSSFAAVHWTPVSGALRADVTRYDGSGTRVSGFAAVGLDLPIDAPEPPAHLWFGVEHGRDDAAAAPLAGADALATWTSLFVLIDTHLVHPEAP